MSVPPASVPTPELSAAPDRALQRDLRVSLAAAVLGVAAFALFPHPHVEAELLAAMRRGLTLWAVLPFAGLLGCIAICPLAAPRFWERNRNKALLTAAIAVPVMLWLLGAWGQAGALELFEKGREYISFLCLLASLYVISGGIYVRGSLAGSTGFNTLVLGIGAVLASFIGTTGASMLLVRPLLRANASREDKAHIFVFFIFIVSNCGGLLTPLGDPPLFLGFLKGVPFEWTVLQLWPLWLFINGTLLFVFAAMDYIVFNREEARRPGNQHEEVKHHAPLGIDGWANIFLLLGIVGVVFASGRGVGFGGAAWPFGIQEGLMVALAVASFFLTPKKVHVENHFSFSPMVEVAVLFAGIFVTMIPALLMLNEHAPELGMSRSWHFFWATGALSSFLDNAPTYLTMSAAASGLQGVTVEGRFLGELLLRDGGPTLLVAVSAGAVLMGANTYIGNGPNFMVKAVAEQRGVKMPSFFGYMAYSGLVLIPIFIEATLLFFRG